MKFQRKNSDSSVMIFFRQKLVRHFGYLSVKKLVRHFSYLSVKKLVRHFGYLSLKKLVRYSSTDSASREPHKLPIRS